MGLNIIIGEFAEANAEGWSQEEIQELKSSYQRLNFVLKSKGLIEYHELEKLPILSYNCDMYGFPYSWIHLLRRAYLYALKEIPLTPQSDRKSRDPLLDEEYNNPRFCSHLIHHSDTDGFYVPVDFQNPIDTEEFSIGSSYALLNELRTVAPIIGIHLKDGRLLGKMISELKEVEEGHEFGIEKKVWFTLFELANKSIEHITAIKFC